MNEAIEKPLPHDIGGITKKLIYKPLYLKRVLQVKWVT
jgi:hypothetical protein